MDSGDEKPVAKETTNGLIPPTTFMRSVLTEYHRQLQTYLQQQRSELWNWFSAGKHRAKAYDTARLDLLKTAYRLDRESNAVLYLQCDGVAERMGLTAPVTLYQAQHCVGWNATLIWLPEEAHVVLHGSLQESLTEREMEALLAHELAHYELLSIDDGAFHIVDEILTAMINDRHAAESNSRTWRNYKLYTELFCDRRAAIVTEDIDACICCLLKIETGQSTVNAAAYLQQAEEIVAQEKAGSEGVTHPEMYIRAKSLQFWADDPSTCDAKVKPLIQGPLSLKTLDLLQQHDLTRSTEELLREFLKPRWLRTNVLMGHARRFFEDFSVTESLDANRDGGMAEDLSATDPAAIATTKTMIAECDEELRNYFCYVLLDFGTCDPDLEEAALAAAFVFANDMGLGEPFNALATTELKIGKRTLQRVQKNAVSIVQDAETEFAK